MKYMLTIFSFVVLSTIVTLFFLWPAVPENSSLMITRNGTALQKDSYHQGVNDGRSSASQTRQVLVQEAQRLGIDQEESFRRSLKAYYEQSLVKVLTDRKLAEIEVTVSEEDIDRYLSCSGKNYTFTRFLVEKGTVVEKGGSTSTAYFDDLSATMRLLIADLEPGESAKQYETGTETSLIRLDKIEVPDDLKIVPYDRGRVREQLANHQRSIVIDRWINGLQQKHKSAKK